MIDVKTPESPGWWLLRCHRKLYDRLPRLERLHRYRIGDPPLKRSTETERRAFQEFRKTGRLNMADLLVSSLTERMAVRAIRTAAQAGNTQAGDEDAMAIFKANQLQVELPDVLDNMLGLADAYMAVGVDPDVKGVPTAKQIRVTAEDPRQVVTIHDPVQQSKLRAAAKFFHDPDEQMDYAYLHLPGRVFVAKRPRKAAAKSLTRFSPTAWSWDEERGGEEGQALPAGLEDVVGIVRFRNRRGVSEFELHLDVLDRINHGILQRMVIVTMQAFRQRALSGDLPRTYPEDWPVEAQRGQVIDYDEIFVSSPDALWLLPGDTNVWESAQADIQGVLSAVQDDLKHLAAATRRPFWIFAPDNQSASGAEHANDGLVFATEDREMRAGAALEQVISIALRFMGKPPEQSAVENVSVDWMPSERYGLQTKATAAQAAKAAGMSARWILENVWQADPDQVAIEEQAKADDQLAAAMLVNGVTDATADQPTQVDSAQAKAQADALGVLIRAGVAPEDAAARVGMTGVRFTGAVPVSLRVPESEATSLEKK